MPPAARTPRPGRLGVCSWSLRPDSPELLARGIREVGVDCLQLALDPLRTDPAWEPGRVREVLTAAGLTIRSGMMGTLGEDYSTLESIRLTGGVRPDAHWDENRRAASANARLAHQLELPLISFHAGFLPETAGTERTKLLLRLREIVDRFAEHGVVAAFETGQERAEVLIEFLEELERPAAGVNFDPANMILYGMGDPLAALDRLAPWVRQIHVKDARRAQQPGTWGSEVPVGTGEVDWSAFFDLVREHSLGVDLMIEREAGEDRCAEMRLARERVQRELERTR